MKRFVYFENTEGGMSVFDVATESDVRQLYGWMSEDCRKDDEALLLWMATAEVGDAYEHRLGWLVRLKDTEAATLALWIGRGFTERHVFAGEYTLLVNPATLDKVRIYENGNVWVFKSGQGSYQKERE